MPEQGSAAQTQAVDEGGTAGAARVAVAGVGGASARPLTRADGDARPGSSRSWMTRSQKRNETKWRFCFKPNPAWDSVTVLAVRADHGRGRVFRAASRWRVTWD